MASEMTIDEQLEQLRDGCVDLIREVDLRNKLTKAAQTGRPLRVKLGADPTAPDLHLGHTVVLQKLRQFQQLGHTVIFLIGDFTGMIGDPTGRSATRPPLSREEILANAETYKQQVFKLLDPDRTVIDFNSRWLGTLTSEEWIRLTAKVTVAQILERDDFQKRMQQGISISLHELLYPVAQAYDSVALQADVELGGTDQKFNLLVGRDLQLKMGQEPQVVITVPLLVGTDGVQKMSKSYGNYIGINEPPDQIYGKVMSIPDDVMWTYWALLTGISPQGLRTLQEQVETGRLSPRDAKAALAQKLVSQFHSEAAARHAAEQFDRIFREKQAPDTVPALDLAVEQNPMEIARLLLVTQFASSMREARRLIEQGGVSINNERVSDVKAVIDLNEKREILLKVGKRRFLKVRTHSQ